LVLEDAILVLLVVLGEHLLVELLLLLLHLLLLRLLLAEQVARVDDELGLVLDPHIGLRSCKVVLLLRRGGVLAQIRRLWGQTTLPAQIHVGLELTRIGGSHDDLLAPVTHHREVPGDRVHVQTHHQLEEALLRIGTTLLAHVVVCRLREVQTTHGDLADDVLLEIDAVEKVVGQGRHMSDMTSILL